MQRFKHIGSFGFRGVPVHLVYAQALEATGDHVQARQVVKRALERLLRQADKIGDPELRRSFLEAVPEHRQLIALAHAWDAAAPEPRADPRADLRADLRADSEAAPQR